MTTVRQRIGDVERDRATECLREHMASGRLEPAEFDDRLEKALTAHYQSDIDGLFFDLPAPHPQRAAQPEPAATAQPDPYAYAATYGQPVPREQQAGCAKPQSNPGWSLMVVLMWVGAIAVCATVSWHLWWLMFIPLLMSGGMGKHHHGLSSQQRHRMRRLDRGAGWNH